MRNRPPPIRIMSRHDIPMRKTVKSGAVRPMSQVSPKSMITRKMKARERPIWRARRALFVSRRAVKDGDENEIVDPEHDLERGQRDQRGPRIWVGQQR